MVDWIRGACTTVEEMVHASPLKPGEVDGVEIVGFMDGVRIVNRMKKKLAEDVDEFCFGSVCKPSSDDSACNVQSPACNMGPSSSQADDGFQSSDGFK